MKRENPILPNPTVRIDAPARLHLGFLDLNGGLGRRFGSLGLTLDEVRTRLRVEPAREFSVAGPHAERVERCARRLQSAFGLPDRMRVVVEEVIPEHIGLGSGTQLSLALGTALSLHFGLGVTVRQTASLLDRGARSGIGIGAFESGGFILDGGRGSRDEPPEVISRLDFPEEWRVVLVLDRRGQGMHGTAEVEAFKALPPFPEASAGHLCRLMLMRALPALTEHDVMAFGSAISEVQRVVGDHFAPAQGGRFASAEVSDALAWLERHGAAGVGQSSWGPTGFAIVGSETEAALLAREAQSQWGELLEFRVCRGRNRGSTVSVGRPDACMDFEELLEY